LVLFSFDAPRSGVALQRRSPIRYPARQWSQTKETDSILTFAFLSPPDQLCLEKTVWRLASPAMQCIAATG
jgi:hypothetical protein